MNKEQAIEILKNKGYKVEMRNLIPIIYLEDYTNDEMVKVRGLIKDYKGSFGFKPLKKDAE